MRFSVVANMIRRNDLSASGILARRERQMRSEGSALTRGRCIFIEVDDQIKGVIKLNLMTTARLSWTPFHLQPCS